MKQQFLVALGFTLFFVYSFWGYKILTPDTPREAFFWMLIVRGVGMAMLFIPVSTLSLSTLKGKQIGEGAAFTGMMRQLGGSFGIAAITTFISRQNVVHSAALRQHLDINDPAVQGRLAGMERNFINKGMTLDAAHGAAYKSLEGMVMKQAAVLSYMDVFLYIGVVFLVCVPFILMIKTRKGAAPVSMSEAMH